MKSEYASLVGAFSYYLEFNRRFSMNTVKSYQADVQSFFNFLENSLEKNLDAVEFSDVLSYLSVTSENKKTQARSLSSLRHFFRYLHDFNEKLSVDLDLDQIRIRRFQQHIPFVLDLEETEQFFSHIDLNSASGIRDKAILEMLYSCGLRVSELINLAISDVELSDGWVSVIGKGSKQRMIPLGEVLLEDLQRYFKESYPSFAKNKSKHKGFLFLTRLGGPFTRVGIWKLVKKYATKSGLNVNIYPHTLRHTFATHLCSNGADLRAVQFLLGHSQLSTTKIYTHIKKDELKKMINQYHPILKK